MPDTPPSRPSSEGSVDSLEDAITEQLAGRGVLGHGEILTGYVVLARTVRIIDDGLSVRYTAMSSQDVDADAKLISDVTEKRIRRQINSWCAASN